MIRFPDREVIGKGTHRSGWPWCVDALEPLKSNAGILFDDFIERTFVYEPISEPIKEPWVGIFHHPPYVFGRVLRIPYYLRGSILSVALCDSWEESKKRLMHAICFSEEAAKFLRSWLGISCSSLVHPTETPDLKWTRSRFESNEFKKVIQIGFQLRNLRGIYQLPPVPNIGKARFSLVSHHVTRDAELLHYWTGKRIDFGGVEELSRVSNEEYDILLSENIVFLELFGAAANNVILECIVRNTPVLVNRLPATIEYLGADYPLFYSNLDHAADLLIGSAVSDAHCYLKELDKTPFSADYFVGSVREVFQC